MRTSNGFGDGPDDVETRTATEASGGLLITGSSGFVGRRLLHAAARRYPSARILGLVGPGQAADPRSVDLTDLRAVDRVIRDFAPTTVVHLAALSSVAQSSRDDPDILWRTNFDATRNLATAIRERGDPVRLIFASSAEVYGRAFNAGPCDEDAAIAPASPYAQTKAASEFYLSTVANQTLSVVALRLFNHTGPGQDTRFVVPSFAAQIAALNGAGRISVGNLDAERDFSDVDDVVDAYLTLVDANRTLAPYQVFNVGSGQTRSVRSVLETLIRHHGHPVEAIVDPARRRASDVPIAAGVFTRFQQAYGWRPRRDLDQTIATILEDQKSGRNRRM